MVGMAQTNYGGSGGPAPAAPVPPQAGQVVRLAEDQMRQLVELLTPGYNLAMLYLAQHEAAQATSDQVPPDPAPGTPVSGS